MRVLVTGGCGFLGSHICELFKKKGWEVIALDNLTNYEFRRSGYSKEARMYNSHYLMKKYNIPTTLLDIRRWSELKHLKADYIVHTAAQPTMTLSIKDPRYDLEVNVLGTFNMLELARKLDIPIAICSTIHVYGNKINQNLKEEKTRFVCDPPSIGENFKILNGDITPLHASKRSSEIYGLCYIDTYGLKAGIMRLSGMYGPRQFAGMHHGWVSNFIIRTLLQAPIYIFGTDKQVRDILYCKDAANLFYKFWEHQIPGLYTVGGGEDCTISIREVLDIIQQITGIKQKRILKERRFGDLYYFVADISKARRLLHWTPVVLPREGLKQTVLWVKEHLNLFRGVC